MACGKTDAGSMPLLPQTCNARGQQRLQPTELTTIWPCAFKRDCARPTTAFPYPAARRALAEPKHKPHPIKQIVPLVFYNAAPSQMPAALVICWNPATRNYKCNQREKSVLMLWPSVSQSVLGQRRTGNLPSKRSAIKPYLMDVYPKMQKSRRRRS